MVYGRVYIIKNKVNNKVYIGQTKLSVEERWKYHKRASRDKNKIQYKFYKAINEIGIDNFYYEILENNILEEKLEEKEVYYISLYNSFKNGYNSTPGGKGGMIITSKLDEKNIINEYLKGKSSVEIGKEYGVCGTTICRILKRNNIEMRDSGRKLGKESLQDIVNLTKTHSCEEIALIYNVHKRTIERFLNKNGIRFRNRK